MKMVEIAIETCLGAKTGHASMASYDAMEESIVPTTRRMS